MFGIIVGTHGNFAVELLKACEMIYGKRDYIKAVTLVPGEKPIDIFTKYENAIKELGNPTRFLILKNVLVFNSIFLAI